MSNESNPRDIGLIITKAPLESSLVKKFLEFLKQALDQKLSIGIFLISDGVYLVKNNQKNLPFEIVNNLLLKDIEIIASKEHLESAGMSRNEIINGIKFSEKPYDDLVDFVMEQYQRVITI